MGTDHRISWNLLVIYQSDQARVCKIQLTDVYSSTVLKCKLVWKFNPRIKYTLVHAQTEACKNVIHSLMGSFQLLLQIKSHTTFLGKGIS